jgi:hypothetical protein
MSDFGKPTNEEDQVLCEADSASPSAPDDGQHCCDYQLELEALRTMLSGLGIVEHVESKDGVQVRTWRNTLDHPLGIEGAARELDAKKFYDLMQVYRWCPISDQAGTVAAFEAVKTHVKAILSRHEAQVDGWVSVKEREPKLSGSYIVTFVSGTVGVAHWNEPKKIWGNNPDFTSWNVTHWQPLPAPPAPEGK